MRPNIYLSDSHLETLTRRLQQLRSNDFRGFHPDTVAALEATSRLSGVVPVFRVSGGLPNYPGYDAAAGCFTLLFAANGEGHFSLLRLYSKMRAALLESSNGFWRNWVEFCRWKSDPPPDAPHLEMPNKPNASGETFCLSVSPRLVLPFGFNGHEDTGEDILKFDCFSLQIRLPESLVGSYLQVLSAALQEMLQEDLED